MSALHDFPGGLKLEGHKHRSNQTPIRNLPLVRELVLPLNQHIGAAAEPCVAVGETVQAGQIIASAIGAISANVHAPATGVVHAIEPRPIAHVSGLTAPSIVLQLNSDTHANAFYAPIADWHQAEPTALRERIAHAGIVGMGGAGFPTAAKLNVGDRAIHTLILNGAECEPYITCDDLLMREQPERIMEGVRILMHLLKAKRCLIAIEDNKPEAIETLYQCTRSPDLTDVKVVRIPTLYPSGGEKQLIKVLTGKEVPSHGLPSQLGIVCHNVGTAAAITDAVLAGRPLISRIVTLTGEGIAEPQNLEVLLGTPAAELVAQAGGYTGKMAKLLMGGPMMGFALPSDEVPLTKGGNCLLALSQAEAPDPGTATPCIRCGECARHCPANLLPQQMYWYTRARNLEKVQDYHLFDCIECGCCSHVCPAHIPLVQYYRYAKTESWAAEREKRKAEHARERHEAREARLLRQEEERKAKLRQKKEALAKKKAPVKGKGKPPGNGADDPKKAAIEAARQRAAAKKKALAEQGVAPRNTENLTPAQQKKVDEANARRKAVQEESADGGPAKETTD